MTEKNIKDLIEYPKNGILSKEIVKDDELSLTLFCMAAGTEMSEHTSSRRAAVYVLEGKGTFNLKGKDIVMEESVLITFPKKAKHSLKAKKKTSFLLYLWE